MNLTPAAQIFSASGDSVFVLDSYSDVVKLYRSGQMYDGPSFDFGKSGENVLAGAFHQLRDGVLYCLLDPSLISGYPSSLKAVTVNPDVLDSISEESNYIIAKIQLKR